MLDLQHKLGDIASNAAAMNMHGQMPHFTVHGAV